MRASYSNSCIGEVHLGLADKFSTVTPSFPEVGVLVPSSHANLHLAFVRPINSLLVILFAYPTQLLQPFLHLVWSPCALRRRSLSSFGSSACTQTSHPPRKHNSNRGHSTHLRPASMNFRRPKSNRVKDEQAVTCSTSQDMKCSTSARALLCRPRWSDHPRPLSPFGAMDAPARPWSPPPSDDDGSVSPLCGSRDAPGSTTQNSAWETVNKNPPQRPE